MSPLSSDIRHLGFYSHAMLIFSFRFLVFSVTTPSTHSIASLASFSDKYKLHSGTVAPGMLPSSGYPTVAFGNASPLGFSNERFPPASETLHWNFATNHGTVGQIVARYSIPLGMVVGPTGMGAPLSMKIPGQKVKRHRRLHTWTAELLMEALRDKFATQSNSVRRAFREVAQPGCSCADEILCVFTSNRS